MGEDILFCPKLAFYGTGTVLQFLAALFFLSSYLSLHVFETWWLYSDSTKWYELESDIFRNAKIISWRGPAVLSKWNTTAGIDSLNKSFTWHWSSWNRRHQRWSILHYDDQYCNTNYAILLWIFTSQTTKGWVLEMSYKYRFMDYAINVSVGIDFHIKTPCATPQLEIIALHFYWWEGRVGSDV